MIRKLFGKLNDGSEVYAFTLSNRFLEVTVLTYGATIQSLKYKGKDRVLGYNTIEEYQKNGGYFGATVGRYAGRIGGGEFQLNGETYKLFKNDGDNCLHGGKIGFNAKIWSVDGQNGVGKDFVEMNYISADGEEGFPGELNVKVRFSLDEKGLKIHYTVVSDKDTFINLTNHSYFNLLGTSVIDTHFIQINAEKFLEIDENMTPTGKTVPVEKTPMDFRWAKSIFRDIDEDYRQLKIAGGYDHNFVLQGDGVRQVAEVSTSVDGVWMRVYTDRPCMQFYTGNFIEEVDVTTGRLCGKRTALCLETQGYPNSMNVGENSELDLLKANEVFETETEYVFGEFC